MLKNLILAGLVIVICGLSMANFEHASAQQAFGGGFIQPALNTTQSFISNLAANSNSNPNIQTAISSSFDTIRKLIDFTASFHNSTINVVNATSPVPINTTLLFWIAMIVVVLLVILTILRFIKWVLIFSGIVLFIVVAMMVIGINVKML